MKIAPSLLSADFARLGDEVRSVAAGGADLLHLDVMDGQFVPNLTFGPLLIDAVNRLSDLPLDVHLMIRDPLALARRFVQAGADYLTVHCETVADPEGALAAIKALGARAGLSLNPGTPLQAVLPAAGAADLVLVMSVNPGFGGQAFIESALDKVRELRKLKDGGKTNALISIDGGINRRTAALAAAAGADILVAGSAVFGSADRAAEIAALRGA
ncbi:MAG: ribulose-phosphate 3-epimerase [Candidatus Edwardsbacteria bacterium]|nr:ribulose-phosphate 3-epimerase [Candidatus Edwardsbacteria bacterium]